LAFENPRLREKQKTSWVGVFLFLVNVRNFPYYWFMPKIQASAKLTSKSQTTIPIAIRRALDIGPEDRIVFELLETGEVQLTKAQQPQTDAAVSAYLQFLERDLVQNPQKLSVLQRDERLQALLSGVQIEDFDLS
jgi:antitoxin PrlF